MATAVVIGVVTCQARSVRRAREPPPTPTTISASSHHRHIHITFALARVPDAAADLTPATWRDEAGGLERVMTEMVVENGRKVKRTTTVFSPGAGGGAESRRSVVVKK